MGDNFGAVSLVLLDEILPPLIPECLRDGLYEANAAGVDEGPPQHPRKYARERGDLQ